MEELIKEIPLKNERKISNTGIALLTLTGGAAVTLCALCAPFITPALRRICLPYVPATPTQVANVFIGLASRQGRLVDLGSGDGRIVIEAAKRGFSSEGIELNPWLVLYSRLVALKQGLTHSAKFRAANIWHCNLKLYDNIVVFGVKEMMAELELKLSAEMDTGACVVACRFPLPNWQPVTCVGSGIDRVWLYCKPSS